MTTTYLERETSASEAWALGGRTNQAGTEQSGHTDAEAARLVVDHLRPGAVRNTTDFAVTELDTPGLGVAINGGSASSLVASYVVGDNGIEIGQRRYIVGLEGGIDLVWSALSIPAPDLTNPRIDEVYLVVRDDAYDSSGVVLWDIAYRDGTPATPTNEQPPGPDGNWTRYALLASVAVAAGATEIVNANITDERTTADLNLAGISFQTHGPRHGANSIDPVPVDSGSVAVAATGSGGAADTLSRGDHRHRIIDARQVAATGAAITGSAGLTGSFANLAAASVSLPTSWSSALVIVTGSVLVTAVASAPVVDIRVDIDSDIAASISNLTIPAAGEQTTVPVAHSFVTSESTIDVAIQGRVTSGAASFFAVGTYLLIRAS